MTLSPEQGPRSVHGSMSINTSLGHDALNAGRQKTSPMAELLERRRCAMAQRHIGALSSASEPAWNGVSRGDHSKQPRPILVSIFDAERLRQAEQV
jgi:hypothetical protein